MILTKDHPELDGTVDQIADMANQTDLAPTSGKGDCRSIWTETWEWEDGVEAIDFICQYEREDGTRIDGAWGGCWKELPASIEELLEAAKKAVEIADMMRAFPEEAANKSPEERKPPRRLLPPLKAPVGEIFFMEFPREL